MFGAASLTRFARGLALLALGGAAPWLPGIATLGSAAALLVAVNGIEHWLISSGRAVPLIFERAQQTSPQGELT
ncbi:hypothetical protein [Streptomyces sp. NPDC050485]|uniref:hypothetical protein n=1 Tax=Streptomyces sp. NPDC050485 TaxID=3365617 RepID=UPI00378BB95B